MTRTIQFGTSRFLQAHVDLFAHEAKQAGQAVAPIVVVKTTPPGPRDERVRAFGRPEGFPILIRGLEGGAAVERRVDVCSVERGLSAHSDWDELRGLFIETEVVVCNTADAGYQPLPGDRVRRPPGEVPGGFPAKLLTLLQARHHAGSRPLAIFPCELIPQNGTVLRDAIGDLARAWELPAAFLDWFAHEVTITDTLVDRIVSAAIEPIGAIAEPYALWAVERRPGLALPFLHPDIVLTDRLEPYERLKLHILNLGHSYLAELWHRDARPADEPVRAIITDVGIRERLLTLYADEVLPGFATMGMASAAEAFVATTLARLDNPFLDHRVADIWDNHAIKIRRRVAGFLDWVGPGRYPTLAALAAAYPIRP